MDLVADLAEQFGHHEIRVNYTQNLMLPHVATSDVIALYDILLANGLATGNHDLLGDMICCPGLDYCNLANARSIPIAKEIAKRFEDPARQELIGPLRLNMSGCINACGHHHSGNIGILGVDKKGTELYQISLGGSPKDDAAVGTIIGPGFRAEAVPQAIDTIIDTYIANRSDGETFLDTWRRVGAAPSRRRFMALLDLATGTLVADPAEVATVLEPTADTEALAAAASGNAGPVAIRFPVFNDGRGISLARLLRERHGFTGEIRAVGHLIPDLAQFLLRSGFDTAEITDPDEATVWKSSVERIKHNYQPGFRNPLPLRWDASRTESKSLDERLDRIKSLTDRIREVRRRVEGRIAFSTSLGLEDQAILHAIAESGVDIDVFTLDTGRLFPEVLETVELSELRYGIRIRLVAPEAAEVEALVARDGVFGFRNSVENRKSCCEIRKVRPLNRELKGAQAWISGLRREHSDERASVPLAAWDEAHALVKVNPVADWSTQDLTAYIAANNIPVNPLHARGFVSIGCAPCTRAVQPGEHPRAGRWWWENEEKKECGLHVNPNRKGRAA